MYEMRYDRLIEIGAWLNRWPWGYSYDYARESHSAAIYILALEAL